ncbi:hypothetical protein [Streptomyces phaeochromogenes]
MSTLPYDANSPAGPVADRRRTAVRGWRHVDPVPLGRPERPTRLESLQTFLAT